ncbi:hypothetical protein SEA_NERGAL_12 [Mycobacterium Phage Nergal]|nr:hypothetical protein SEA_NERGAL_12 [Mycobacterium Phage Nergal]
MPQRQVNVTLATYIDEAGVCRIAQQGAVIDVHPSYVERFDRLNVIAGLTKVVADAAEQFEAIAETAVKLAEVLTPVAELVAEVEDTTPDQAEPVVPAEIEPVAEPVADVLELDTPPAPKRTRRKASTPKGE